MILLLYILAAFTGLFILYAVARHDFVLLRQSISLRFIFDNVFITLFVSFLIARVGYIAYMGFYDMFNPLKFFYLTRFWGIQPYLGFVAAYAMLYLLFRKRKNLLRIYDIYFISFTPIILLDVFLKSNSGINIFIKIVSLLVLASFYGWFIKIHNKYTTKDGFITFLTIITYSLVSLSFSFSTMGFFNLKYLWYQILLSIITLLSFLLLILVQKDFFNKQ